MRNEDVVIIGSGPAGMGCQAAMEAIRFLESS